MKNKYNKISIILTTFSLLVLVMLLIFGSYAIFSIDISPNKTHIITVGDLYSIKADISNSGNISITDAVPLIDDLGMQEEYTSISIDNIGDVSLSYSIVLLEDKETYNANGYTASNILPPTVMKYGITKEPKNTTNISYLSQKEEYCSDGNITTTECASLSNDAEYGHVIITGRLNADEVVNYKLRLWIAEETGNVYQNRHYNGQIKVILDKNNGVDVNPPTIIMAGSDEIIINTNDTYNDPGVSAAFDKEDGDVIDSLRVISNVNTSVPGIYYVRYSVHDSQNYYTYASRTVIVKNKNDNCGITFTLNGANPYNMYVSQTYNDPGATAVDSSSNNLPVTTSSVGLDINTPGKYQVIYSATTGTCTDYEYRIVNVLIGSNTYITYTPNGNNGVWSSENISVNFEVADNVPYIVPSQLKYKIGTKGNDNNITYGNEVTVSGLLANYTFDTSGRHSISSTIVGSNNDSLPSLNSNEYYIDKTDPICGNITGESTTWTKENRTITINCSDTHSGCSAASTTKTFNTTTNTNGIGIINIFDKASPNPNMVDCPVNAYVDKINPECGSVTGASTSWTTGTRTVTVACNDTHSGCANNTYTYTFPATFSGSTGNVTISDNATNSTPCPVNVYLDNGIPSAPTITGTTPTNAWAQNNTLTISGGIATSGIASYQYCNSATNSSDNCAWNTYDSNNKPFYNTEGTTYVFARANSTVGTYGAVSQVYIVKIDLTNPSCILSVTNEGIVFASKTDDKLLSAFGMGTTSTANYSGGTNLALGEGTKYGFVIDQAGNTNSCSATITATKKTCKKAATTSSSTPACTSGNYSSPSSACSSPYWYVSNSCSRSPSSYSGTLSCTTNITYKSCGYNSTCSAACSGYNISSGSCTASGTVITGSCTCIPPSGSSTVGKCLASGNCSCPAGSTAHHTCGVRTTYSGTCACRNGTTVNCANSQSCSASYPNQTGTCTITGYSYSGSITCSKYVCSTGSLSSENCYLYEQNDCAPGWSISASSCDTGSSIAGNNLYCYVIN